MFAILTAATKCMKFSSMSFFRPTSLSQRRINVMGRCMLQIIRYWLALNFPVLESPSYAAHNQSTMVTVSAPCQPRFLSSHQSRVQAHPVSGEEEHNQGDWRAFPCPPGSSSSVRYYGNVEVNMKHTTCIIKGKMALFAAFV